MCLPVSVVDDCIDDAVHLLGEFGGVGRVFLSRWTPTFLLGLGGASVLSARRVLVLASLAFALFQPDLLLHLFQVSILNGLETTKSEDRVNAESLQAFVDVLHSILFSRSFQVSTHCSSFKIEPL